MPPTTGYSFGDVVLVPFPFTDQSGTKKRPAVVVSSAAYQAQRRDLVIMAVTTIDHRLVIRRLGQLQQADVRSLRTSLAQILG